MRRVISGFDWDDGNREKCRKHGVPIEAIETLLSGAPRVAPDPSHSRAEDRFIAVGRPQEGRPIFVAFTFRERDGEYLIRPISARYMHKKEIDAYEKKGP